MVYLACYDNSLLKLPQFAGKSFTTLMHKRLELLSVIKNQKVNPDQPDISMIMKTSPQKSTHSIQHPRNNLSLVESWRSHSCHDQVVWPSSTTLIRDNLTTQQKSRRPRLLFVFQCCRRLTSQPRFHPNSATNQAMWNFPFFIKLNSSLCVI